MAPGLKAARLATLLRTFGLCPAEISKQEIESAQAQEHFAKLSTEYDEALTLLEAGVNPIMAAATYGASQHASAHPAFRHHVWREGSRASRHVYEPQQFDTYTRVKGHVIVWSSLFVFLTCLREFLVGCAGSTWAWQPPSNLNPFWVRRYSEAWGPQGQEGRQKPQGWREPRDVTVVCHKSMIRRRQFASLLLTLAVAVLCRSHLEFVTVPDGPRVRRRLLLNVASWAPAAPIYARGQGLDLSFLDPKAPPDVSAPPKDAELLPSGLATKMLLRPTCALFHLSGSFAWGYSW
eukprot:g15456.t1